MTEAEQLAELIQNADHLRAMLPTDAGDGLYVRTLSDEQKRLIVAALLRRERLEASC